MASEKTSVRLPRPLARRVARYAKTRKQNQSEAIRLLLEHALDVIETTDKPEAVRAVAG